jgi:carbon-monoxide dehydrogenase iron sulfur subunit
MKQIFVRLDRCLGCRSCEMACAVEHSSSKNLFLAVSEKPVPRKRLYVELAEGHKIPLTCRHCEDAPCVEVCPTGATSKDPITGIVTKDPEKCVGCWMCTMVCKNGVIGQQRERRIAVKCDLCPDRDTPACVNACPSKTLIYAEEEEFARLLRKEAASKVAKGYAGGA